MVRLDQEDKPMSREDVLGRDLVRLAGILCREKEFAEWLISRGEIFEEDEVVEWMRSELGVQSRSEIPQNQEAMHKLRSINNEYQQWKQQNA